MTPPTYFAVEYAINPWMDTSTPVDTDRAVAQWERLRQTYLRLGHTVDIVEPVAGLPDMVYAANGGFVVGGTPSSRASSTPSAPASPPPTPRG